MRVRHKVALATPLTWPSETRPAKQGAKPCAQLKEGPGRPWGGRMNLAATRVPASSAVGGTPTEPRLFETDGFPQGPVRAAAYQ